MRPSTTPHVCRVVQPSRLGRVLGGLCGALRRWAERQRMCISHADLVEGGRLVPINLDRPLHQNAQILGTTCWKRRVAQALSSASSSRCSTSKLSSASASTICSAADSVVVRASLVPAPTYMFPRPVWACGRVGVWAPTALQYSVMPSMPRCPLLLSRS